MISERPAEVKDRAVPGHWEGDLIFGKKMTSIGTLVERHSRYVILLKLPNGHNAEAVRKAMTKRILTLPAQLRRSITWDQGCEMAEHVQFTIDTGVQVYFCDPKSPWQRGSNENTNGLLRQYLPKASDLSQATQRELDAIARSLNTRPRQTLGWMTPSQAFAEASTGFLFLRGMRALNPGRSEHRTLRPPIEVRRLRSIFLLRGNDRTPRFCERPQNPPGR